MTLRARWFLMIAVGLLGLAAALGLWRYRSPDAPVAPDTAPPPAVSGDGRAAPPPAPSPASPPAAPLVKALPPVKVKQGGTSWSPDPAVAPAPVEAQRGAPDIPGAQPLRPPP